MTRTNTRKYFAEHSEIRLETKKIGDNVDTLEYVHGNYIGELGVCYPNGEGFKSTWLNVLYTNNCLLLITFAKSHPVLDPAHTYISTGE